MRKKYQALGILSVILLTSWIYWRSNDEFNNTLLILTQKNTATKSYVLEPNHTICQDNPLFIIVVTSYVGHVELRSAHRRAMPDDELIQYNAVRIFLLARIPAKESITQAAILDESKTFGDLLQGSFTESYKNLPYKHLMGLQWASTICNKATFILKVDDDIVFNLKNTHKLMNTLNYSQDNFIMGYMLNNTKPRRNKENKWYVTMDEYARNEYPPYLSGWYYIITPKTAYRLYEESIYHPLFWIDDILVTGILAEALGIKLRHLPEQYWLEYYELLECCLNDMIKKSIRCDYVVGPNGGRNNLILEFNDAYKDCEHKHCVKRTAEHNLKQECVAFGERAIFSDDGVGEMHLVKL